MAQAMKDPKVENFQLKVQESKAISQNLDSINKLKISNAKTSQKKIGKKRKSNIVKL